MDTLTRRTGNSVHSAELKAAPEAVRAARAYVAGVLTAWTVPEDVIDMARLLTSELATNAVTHGETAGGTFTLQVRSLGCCLSVEVHDSSQEEPVVRRAAGDTEHRDSERCDSEHGRGLLLVTEIADSWGYYFAGGRKRVWFRLHVADAIPPQAKRARVLPPAALMHASCLVRKNNAGRPPH